MTRSLSFIAASGALLLLAFQNCGSVGDSKLLTKTTPGFVFETFFHYPYSDAPEVYGQVQLATGASTASFNDVQYIAVFGRSDGASAAYDYDIDIVNESGHPVCPGRTGTASTGSTSVVDGCLSQVLSRSVRVTLKVMTGGKTYTFERTYATNGSL